MPTIVTVDASQTVASPFPSRVEYAILVDRSAYEIRAFAREHPRCVVIPFVAEKCPDYPPDMRRLSRGDTSHYICTPFYVGNLEPARVAIECYVKAILDPFPDRVCIKDKTP